MSTQLSLRREKVTYEKRKKLPTLGKFVFRRKL